MIQKNNPEIYCLSEHLAILVLRYRDFVIL